MNIQFATQSYKSESLPLSSQRCVNAYAEKEPGDAKSPVAIFGVPGLSLFATCGRGPIRGMHVMNDVLYVVSGNILFSVSSSGAVTTLGGSVSGANRVSMSDNGTQVMIVNGANGYVWSEANGFQVVTSTNFHAATSVTFFDNYFVLPWDGSNQWFISGSLDGTSYSGTDFASAEVQSDFVLSIVNQQENLLIFGERTIENWYDAGTVNFPFQRIDGGTVERGCAAALTPIKEDNSVFFLGDDLIFYRLDGTLPRRISQHAIEQAWQQYETVSDAYTFSYTYTGHKFITLVFPTANATWVFDIATGLWHERISFDQAGTNLGRWRGADAASVYGKILIGDCYSGRIGYLDNSVFTEFGNLLQAYFVSPPIHNDRKRVFCSRFELDVETGVGNTLDPGSNPQIMLDWSDDGGRTFRGPQMWSSMGKIGEYTRRLRWLRNGQARQRVYRVVISDPVPRVIISAHSDLEVGM